jgi:hypothetical protein
MIAIPLYLFLFLFFLLLLVVGIFAVSNLYHIFTTASFTLASFAITCFVFGVMAVVLFFTTSLLQGVDWTAPVPLLDAEWFRGVLNAGPSTPAFGE